MSKMILNNMPKLQLSNLLRRRRMTLKQMLEELGITTYAGLCNQCSNMGVVPPDEDEFNVIMPPRVVSDPEEGVVIIEPMRVIAELTGEQISEEDLTTDSSLNEVSASSYTEDTQKKRRGRKVETQN